jgi:biopolymer transport protein ExbB
MFVAVFICVAAIPSDAGSNKKNDERPARIASLKVRLAALQDSLDNEIASRWDAKQKYLAQRELDREETAVLKESLERAWLELARGREEVLSTERRIEQAAEGLEQKKEESRYFYSTVNESLDKQADAVFEGFPLDYEQRRMDIEKIRRSSDVNGSAGKTIESLVSYKLAWLNRGVTTSISNTVILPDAGAANNAAVARFGSVFAYACIPEHGAYSVRQTGQIGKQRFSVSAISDENLAGRICRLVTEWAGKSLIAGNVPVDVLQNSQSAALSGKTTVSFRVKAGEFIKAGGPVMIPLLLLPVWAFILIILKMVQYSTRSGRMGSVSLLDIMEKRIAGKNAVETGTLKGIIELVLTACVQLREKERATAEKAVRHILSAEASLLGSHLNTLAVIAGVAPLLGLLGTVTGMINLFDVITSYGTSDPKLMAAGISEALITTETGLVIAIPILLVHNFLRNRRNKILAGFEAASLTILNRFWPL